MDCTPCLCPRYQRLWQEHCISCHERGCIRWMFRSRRHLKFLRNGAPVQASSCEQCNLQAPRHEAARIRIKHQTIRCRCSVSVDQPALIVGRTYARRGLPNPCVIQVHTELSRTLPHIAHPMRANPAPNGDCRRRSRTAPDWAKRGGRNTAALYVLLLHQVHIDAGPRRKAQ